jgi:hypothetical protein
MTGENSDSNLGLPRSVWALGFVSMFMDISSEMILALLPLYLVTVLGTSTTFLAGAGFAMVGLIGLVLSEGGIRRIIPVEYQGEA